MWSGGLGRDGQGSDRVFSANTAVIDVNNDDTTYYYMTSNDESAGYCPDMKILNCVSQTMLSTRP